MKMNELSSCMDNIMAIYAWIDEIPFSRPKKNLARDFSDGGFYHSLITVLMAEVLRLYFPRLVNAHNYIPASNVASKIDNWNTLNRRILSKIDMKLSKEVINQLANAQQGVIEKVLMDLRRKIITKDCNESNNSLDGYIRKSIPNTESEASQNCETKKTSSSQKTGTVKSNDDKNLVGKASGWFAGWMWPFGNHSKSPLNQESSPASKNPIQKSSSHPIGTDADDSDNSKEMISRHKFNQLRQEVAEKNAAIGMLSRKVSCLESMVKLKDQKIGTLSAKISSPEAVQNLRPHVMGSSIARLRPQSKKINQLKT